MNNPISWPEFQKAYNDNAVLAWLDGDDDRLDEDALWKKWREEHRETWITERLRQVRLALALGLAGLKRLTLYPDGKGGDADDCFWNHFCDACCGRTAARLLAQIDDEDAHDQMLMAPGDGEFESLYAAYRQEQRRLDAEAARVEAERKAEEERRAREEAERKAEEERARKAEAKAARKAVLELRAKEDAERLPDGLEMLVLQFNIGRPGYVLDEDDRRQRSDIAWVLTSTIGWVGRTTGETEIHTVFGPVKHQVMRLNVVAKSETLNKWAGDDNKQLLRNLGLRRTILTLTHAKRTTTTYGAVETEIEWEDYFKGVFLDNLPVPPRGRPEDGSWLGGSFIETIEADFELVRELAENCDGDAGTINDVLVRAEPTPTFLAPKFLIPGLIGERTITLLLGHTKHGKSSLLTELAVACARRDTEFFGLPLNVGKGQVAFLTGEDTAEAIREHVEAMVGGKAPHLLWVLDGTDIDTAIAAIGTKPIGLLIVDPARKFLDGNEDDSGPVSEFFTKMEELARRKCCAVIVAHHLRRGGVPRALHELAQMMRGSQVWLDRPRATIGLVRRRQDSLFGLCTLNGIPLYNYRLVDPMEKPLRLTYDKATRRHTLETGAAPLESEAIDDVEARVFAAIVRLIEEGQRVSTSSASELYKHKAPEIAGLSRAVVRAAVDELVDSGRLSKDKDGVLSLNEE